MKELETMKELELKVEELEERIAPATLVVSPKGLGGFILNERLADQGCDHGITPSPDPGNDAQVASSGVVSCGGVHIEPPGFGGDHGNTGGDTGSGSGSDDNLSNFS